MRLRIDQLVEPRIPLRHVDVASVGFLELVESIKKHGLLCSISVRPLNHDLFEIIDGLHRYYACREIGLTEISATILSVTEMESIGLQIQANACRLETTPIEYAVHLQRLLQMNPDMTIAQLAKLVSKSPQWIKSILGLLRLTPEIQKFVQSGDMCLQNAVALAKIWRTAQAEYLNQALTMNAREFGALARSAAKKMRESVRTGSLAEWYSDNFTPQPFLRPLRELKEEIDTPTIAGVVIAAEGCTTVVEAFRCALLWAMNLDKLGVEKQRKTFLDRQVSALRKYRNEVDRDNELGKA
jgi:ParB/RepB/Spo0J family partition protein